MRSLASLTVVFECLVVLFPHVNLDLLGNNKDYIELLGALRKHRQY